MSATHHTPFVERDREVFREIPRSTAKFDISTTWYTARLGTRGTAVRLTALGPS